jgi:sulfoxide reductase heme-binding subunit YedZ
VVPFAGAYRPLWLGLGTLALDVAIAVFLSSLVRKRIGWTVWRAVHWAAYAMWPLAFFHALGNGSDSGQAWLRIIAGLCFFAVAATVTWRVSASFTITRAPRVPRMPERPAPVGVRGVPTSSMPVRR